MKKVISLLLAMLMVLSLVACGGAEKAEEPAKEEAPAASATESTEAKEEAPAAEKPSVVRIPLQSVGASLDPHTAILTVDMYVYDQIYEGLYQLMNDGTLEPRLATSYEVAEDGMSYTYHLRDDVVFHNGDPFTAADVVYSFERCMENAYRATDYTGLESVEALDDYTVRFNMAEPNSVFVISMTYTKIINKNVLEAAGDAYGVGVDLAGTGPYYIESYDQTTKTVLKAFPEYYRGQASIETVEFIPMLDASTQLMAFESGQFDICSVNAADWDMVSSSGKYNTLQAPGRHVSYILINIAKPESPLYDKRVRQAIAYCMNKEDMIAIAAEGLADLANYMVRPDLIADFRDHGTYYTQDIEKAKELLAEAGYADGFEVTIQAINVSRYIKMAEVLQENLAAIGITANIEMGESGTYLTTWKDDKLYDIGVSGQTPTYSYLNFCTFFDGTRQTLVQSDLNEEIDVEYIQDLKAKALAATSIEEQTEYWVEIDKYCQECAGYLPVMNIQTLYAWNQNLNAAPPILTYDVYSWSWN